MVLPGIYPSHWWISASASSPQFTLSEGECFVSFYFDWLHLFLLLISFPICPVFCYRTSAFSLPNESSRALMQSAVLVQILFVPPTSSRRSTSLSSSSPPLPPSCSPSTLTSHTLQFLIESPLLSRCGARVHQSDKDGCQTPASIMNV